MEAEVKAFELRELWRRYKEGGDAGARERLVVAYSPLVKFVAGRTGARLPSHVDQADLISYGMIGLIEAMERFEPRPPDPLRDLRDAAHPRRDHRRAALARLGAALGPLARARHRGGELQARARARPRPDRRRARRAPGIDRGGAAGGAAADLQLLDPRPGGALDDPRRLWRQGLPARHDRGRERPRPAGGARHQRGQGPARRGDPGPARARDAGGRPLLLREPDPAGDRRGPRRHRVPGLPAALEGGAAPAVAVEGTG